MIGRDRVVVARLEPHHPARLGCPEVDRERRAECDRDLADQHPRVPLADARLDPVDHLEHVDVALEERAERALVALARDVVPRRQRDIRSGSGDPVACLASQRREQLDALDLLGRHHPPADDTSNEVSGHSVQAVANGDGESRT